jgi:hypothetical protein
VVQRYRIERGGNVNPSTDTSQKLQRMENEAFDLGHPGCPTDP